MELGAQIAAKEPEDAQMEVMVNGVENEEGDVLKGNKLHANSHGTKFKRVDSNLESSTVFGMATHGSVSINDKINSVMTGQHHLILLLLFT